MFVCEKTFTPLRAYKRNSFCCVSPDSSTVASGSSGGSVRLWDSRSGNFLGVLEGHTETVYSVDFHRGGQRLVSGGSDGAIRLWDVHTGECLQTVDRNWGNVSPLAFSPDGLTLASSMGDRKIALWYVSAGNDELAADIRIPRFTLDG